MRTVSLRAARSGAAGIPRVIGILAIVAALGALAVPAAARAAPSLVPAVGLRLGLASAPLGTGDARAAPVLGVEGDLAIGRHLEVHLAWDATFATGGTSVVSVSSVRHGLSLLADGRLRLGKAIAVAAGIGPGLTVEVATDRAGSSRSTLVTVLPGAAWEAMLELDAGRLGVRLGVLGRVDRSGWPMAGLVCIRLRFAHGA